jgi:hypoxia up-regulated 1
LFGVTSNKKRLAFVSQEKKRIHRKSLDVKISYISRVRPHTAEEIVASKDKLLAMAQRDKERMMLQEAKNRVESYIYKIKNKLLDDEEVIASVTTPEQREEVSQLASNAEMWLEDDGYDADLPTMEAKYTEISTPFESILLRVTELKALPAAVEAVEKKLKEMEDLMVLWNTSKPHILETEKQMVLSEVNRTRQWIAEIVQEQSLVEPHKEPIVLSTDLPEKIKLAETLIMALASKKPPIVPKKSKKKKDKNTTTTIDINATNIEDLILDEENTTDTNTTNNTTNSTEEIEKEKEPVSGSSSEVDDEL